MYIPSDFLETNTSRLQDFIGQNSFGLLVTQVGGKSFATHLPFLLDRTAGHYGTLIGHMARANPQWHEAAGQNALAIFSGPHAYISPTWYEAAQTVPTWNYTAVHAYGPVEIVEDQPTFLQILHQSVEVYERGKPYPWLFDPSSTIVERLLPQIVGFRIRIETIEGKFKLNQNHPEERRRKVIRALQEQGDENSLAVAAMMRARLPTEEGDHDIGNVPPRTGTASG